MTSAGGWPWERALWQKAALLDIDRYAPEFSRDKKRPPVPVPAVGVSD